MCLRFPENGFWHESFEEGDSTLLRHLGVRWCEETSTSKRDEMLDLCPVLYGISKNTTVKMFSFVQVGTALKNYQRRLRYWSISLTLGICRVKSILEILHFWKKSSRHTDGRANRAEASKTLETPKQKEGGGAKHRNTIFCAPTVAPKSGEPRHPPCHPPRPPSEHRFF